MHDYNVLMINQAKGWHACTIVQQLASWPTLWQLQEVDGHVFQCQLIMAVLTPVVYHASGGSKCTSAAGHYHPAPV